MPKVNEKYIVGIIITLLFVVVLFQMLPTLLPSVISSVAGLFTNLSGESANLGGGASSFASNVKGYLGWFWVLGPFILVVGIILSIFKFRTGGRRR